MEMCCCNETPPNDGQRLKRRFHRLAVLWLKPARNPPNRTRSSAAACGGFYIVNQAVEAMANKDEVTLTEIFDSSIGNLRQAMAFQAIQRCNSMQTKTDIPIGGALGPIQSRQMQASESRGQTTVVPMIATDEIGAVRWEFSLRQTEQGWKLLDILGKVTEQRQP